MKLTGAQMVCESLIREGVDVVFGIPGGAILPLYQTMPEYPQIRHILTRHEHPFGAGYDDMSPQRRRYGRRRRHRRHAAAGDGASGAPARTLP